ncbi:S1C family serine protease [Streptomyces sp. WMMC1477]|uniref:S1C family serine protease n=1 Tax=Streptomyces sp. WMMC1477 TaxID=3015155 RepID=UPI0022B733B5|nr:trypsin-like peptidase domain-containing protein [Streptomyces sp. WMMC1477]MCZ7433492.1 trypsin-like peptidase domain-containing protein [Streptomyces sp. WMMC1477]
MDEARESRATPQWWSRPIPVPAPQARRAEGAGRQGGRGTAKEAAPVPRHGEDPYSTPPYGDPGPWSPAPLVQHPGATPSGGTPLPPPHPTAPSTATPPAGTAVGTAPAGATPAAGTAVHGTPAAGTPTARTVTGGTPAAGTPVPSAPGAPAPTDAYAETGGHAPGPATGSAAPVPGSAAPATGAAPQVGWRGYDPWSQPSSGGPAQPERPEPGGRRRGRLLAAVLACVLVAAVAGGFAGAYLERNGDFGSVTLPQSAPGGPERPADSVAGIAAATLPGVVTIHVRGGGAQGTGTGFVLDDRGHILTNHHVVSPAGEDGRIQVTFSSGHTARARLVGGDGGYDLAVVKVDGVQNLRPLPLGNSDSVQVGDPVVAIGAPFDLAGTVTSGIISAKERPITAGGEDASDISYVDALQTDAPINPGNSGGPLVDVEGRVIGVNSAIRSAEGAVGESQGGSIGLGFAIPINQAKRVAEELINTGHATHPVIGVRVDMSYSGDGALVGVTEEGRPAVVEDGPADRAGIQEGDVITAVDGDVVRTGEELIVKIRSHRPGDALELTVRRDGEEDTVVVTLDTARGD